MDLLARTLAGSAERKEMQKRRLLRIAQVRKQTTDWNTESREQFERSKEEQIQKIIAELTEEAEQDLMTQIKAMMEYHDAGMIEIGKAHCAVEELPDYEKLERKKAKENRKKAHKRFREALALKRREEAKRQENASKLQIVRTRIFQEATNRAKLLPRPYKRPLTQPISARSKRPSTQSVTVAAAARTKRPSTQPLSVRSKRSNTARRRGHMGQPSKSRPATNTRASRESLFNEPDSGARRRRMKKSKSSKSKVDASAMPLSSKSAGQQLIPQKKLISTDRHRKPMVRITNAKSRREPESLEYESRIPVRKNGTDVSNSRYESRPLSRPRANNNVPHTLSSVPKTDKAKVRSANPTDSRKSILDQVAGSFVSENSLDQPSIADGGKPKKKRHRTKSRKSRKAGSNRNSQERNQKSNDRRQRKSKPKNSRRHRNRKEDSEDEEASVRLLGIEQVRSKERLDDQQEQNQATNSLASPISKKPIVQSELDDNNAVVSGADTKTKKGRQRSVKISESVASTSKTTAYIHKNLKAWKPNNYSSNINIDPYPHRKSRTSVARKYSALDKSQRTPADAKRSVERASAAKKTSIFGTKEAKERNSAKASSDAKNKPSLDAGKAEQATTDARKKLDARNVEQASSDAKKKTSLDARNVEQASSEAKKKTSLDARNKTLVDTQKSQQGSSDRKHRTSLKIETGGDAEKSGQSTTPESEANALIGQGKNVKSPSQVKSSKKQTNSSRSSSSEDSDSEFDSFDEPNSFDEAVIYSVDLNDSDGDGRVEQRELLENWVVYSSADDTKNTSEESDGTVDLEDEGSLPDDSTISTQGNRQKPDGQLPESGAGSSQRQKAKSPQEQPDSTKTQKAPQPSNTNEIDKPQAKNPDQNSEVEQSESESPFRNLLEEEAPMDHFHDILSNTSLISSVDHFHDLLDSDDEIFEKNPESTLMKIASESDEDDVQILNIEQVRKNAQEKVEKIQPKNPKSTKIPKPIRHPEIKIGQSSDETIESIPAEDLNLGSDHRHETDSSGAQEVQLILHNAEKKKAETENAKAKAKIPGKSILDFIASASNKKAAAAVSGQDQSNSSKLPESIGGQKKLTKQARVSTDSSDEEPDSDADHGKKQQVKAQNKKPPQLVDLGSTSTSVEEAFVDDLIMNSLLSVNKDHGVNNPGANKDNRRSSTTGTDTSLAKTSRESSEKSSKPFAGPSKIGKQLDSRKSHGGDKRNTKPVVDKKKPKTSYNKSERFVPSSSSEPSDGNDSIIPAIIISENVTPPNRLDSERKLSITTPETGRIIRHYIKKLKAMSPESIEALSVPDSSSSDSTIDSDAAIVINTSAIPTSSSSGERASRPASAGHKPQPDARYLPNKSKPNSSQNLDKKSKEPRNLSSILETSDEDDEQLSRSRTSRLTYKNVARHNQPLSSSDNTDTSSGSTKMEMEIQIVHVNEDAPGPNSRPARHSSNESLKATLSALNEHQIQLLRQESTLHLPPAAESHHVSATNLRSSRSGILSPSSSVGLQNQSETSQNSGSTSSSQSQSSGGESGKKNKH